MGISLNEYKEGLWEFRLTYYDPITDQRKERSKRGFKRKKDARIEAQRLEDQLLNNFDTANHNMLLKEYMEHWLTEYKKDVVRKNTYKLHQTNINKHIIPYFQNIKIKNLKPTMYQKFLNHLYNEGYAKRTVEIIHGTLRNGLEKAKQLNIIDRNPAEGATIKGKSKKQTIKFIDSSDISNFLTEARQYGYIYWMFYYFLIETGMRKGEAAAIQWSDINFKEKTVRINKSLDFQASTNDQLFGDTKTYRSTRTITLRDPLIDKLKFHLKWQNENKKTFGDLYHHDFNLVLCRDDGNYMPKSSLFNSFERILKRAGLPKLPIHSLRHTHVVILMESGWNDYKQIQERLGHGSYQITADVYAHISDRINQEGMQKYDDYMKTILKE
ncbi:site-specific integrase [Alkalibacillus almallahensis]|uniref:site-specific integrase n=1 Tax=Alkalibacillus almallahensis TaxID=1379154 RepID=UPI001421BA0F|nr:site-specific integrase [Alkalibacillus almallahensis]NIK10872.1 integrase [Alkalibacillus almallahensis]